MVFFHLFAWLYVAVFWLWWCMYVEFGLSFTGGLRVVFLGLNWLRDEFRFVLMCH
jgi:hypothetical protein